MLQNEQAEQGAQNAPVTFCVLSQATTVEPTSIAGKLLKEMERSPPTHCRHFGSIAAGQQNVAVNPGHKYLLHHVSARLCKVGKM